MAVGVAARAGRAHPPRGQGRAQARAPLRPTAGRAPARGAAADGARPARPRDRAARRRGGRRWRRRRRREGRRAGGRGALDKEAIHDTRKALKRLRALVRLLRAELGERRYKREHAILRDAARRLAGARDAEVMVGTLDALLERHPRELGRRRQLIELRKRLVAERAAAERATLGDRATRGEVLRELRRPARAGAAVEPARTARHRPRRARPAADLPRRARAQAPRRAREGAAARTPRTSGENASRICATPPRSSACGRSPAAPTGSPNCSARSTTWSCSPACSRAPGARRSRASAAGGRARPCSRGSRAAADVCASARCARGSACTRREPKKFVRRVRRAHAHALRK